MDITLDKKSPTEASIKIKLTPDDYQLKVEEKVKDYARKAHLKGFRKGKVPPGVIRKMYGKSILVDEINHLLSHSLNDYIKEKELKLIGEPLPNTEQNKAIDWEHQTEFEFDYDLGLVDEFEYDFKKLKVKAYNIEVGQKELQETIDNLRTQNGTVTNPETSEEGDSLYGDLIRAEDDHVDSVLIEIDKLNKGKRPQFYGLKKGDEISFEIEKTIDDPHYLATLLNISKDEATSLKGSYRFLVKNVNRTVPAELNQEFFDKILGPGKAKSKVEFEDHIRVEIKKNYDKEADYFLEKSLIEHLVDKTIMSLPSEFLKKYLKFTNQKVEDSVIDEEFDSYVKDLKWNLIKNKIAEDHGIKVEHEDVVDKAKEMIRAQFGAMGTSEHLESNLDAFADNYLKGEDGNNYMKVFNIIRYEKTLAILKEKASITDKKVKVEEFQKLTSK